MTSGNLWRSHKRVTARNTFTPLNLETNRRHALCQMTGGCQPGSDTVTRVFNVTGIRELRVCRSCGVPMGAPKQPNWASG